MKFLPALALIGFTCAAAPQAAYADVQLSIGNGRVSLVAKDATLRQILTEWARVGQTRIVNVDRIPGGPMTLELKDMPEDQALDLLLRSVSGYLAAPRPVMVASVSRFDRIVVMPTVAQAKPTVTAAAPTFNAPPAPAADDDEEDRAVPNAAPTPNPRGPVFNAFPQPRVVNPQQQQQQPSVAPGTVPPQQQQPDPNGEPAAYPGGATLPPGTVAAPGMIAPAPAPAPGQQPVPVRRPGGGPGGPGGL
ncbi:MAG TPA: hypothetical protein VHU82_02810 [Vicinamibacterales bacterium]|jgi:hypothetical protein|nr:hypothetical protein [Vicinamibacterales bacterium]